MAALDNGAIAFDLALGRVEIGRVGKIPLVCEDPPSQRGAVGHKTELPSAD